MDRALARCGGIVMAGYHFLFELADGWALGANDQQWIVLKRRNSRTQRGWKPLAYVATSTQTLRRVLLEKGVRLSPEADAQLEALPKSLQDFTQDWHAGRF